MLSSTFEDGTSKKHHKTRKTSKRAQPPDIHITNTILLYHTIKIMGKNVIQRFTEGWSDQFARFLMIHSIKALLIRNNFEAKWFINLSTDNETIAPGSHCCVQFKQQTLGFKVVNHPKTLMNKFSDPVQTALLIEMWSHEKETATNTCFQIC